MHNGRTKIVIIPCLTPDPARLLTVCAKDEQFFGRRGFWFCLIALPIPGTEFVDILCCSVGTATTGGPYERCHEQLVSSEQERVPILARDYVHQNSCLPIISAAMIELLVLGLNCAISLWKGPLG